MDTNHRHDSRVVTIATSLAPRDYDIQRKAISTWIQSGFRVVSINTLPEMSLLHPYFSDVKFVIANRDASDKHVKPYIYFDDFLSYFSTQDCQVCGIVNSDIFLLKKGLHDFIYKEAIQSFIFGSRIDVHDLDSQIGLANIWGYDFFFFDRQIISYYPQEEFCIGLPWWDYWAPLIPVKYNLTVKKIVTPLAYHIIHPGNYDEETLNKIGYILARHFPPPFLLSDATMPAYGSFLRNMLKMHSIKVEIADHDGAISHNSL